MFDDFLDDDDELYDDAGTPASDNASALRAPREAINIIGHEELEQTFLTLFNNQKLPHAMIFAGPKGIGKASTAFRLAKFLLKHGKGDDNQDSLFGEAAPAETPVSLDVAESDPVFQRVASSGHSDLLTIERPLDTKGEQKSSIDVDSVRKVAPFLRMTSAEGGWRVVIVDDAESMNRNAQNALLKILEEPPKKVLLILICHRLGAMIPTIRSRCRTFHFQALSNETLTGLLKSGVSSMTGSEVKLLADMAAGSIGRAMELHDEGGQESINTITTLLSTWPQMEWPRIHHLADSLGRFGASEASYNNFANIFVWICESFLRAKAVNSDKLPETLKTEALEALKNHYSLEQWIEICEKLKAHFTAVDVSNLDKRQGVIGAFAILGGQSL